MISEFDIMNEVLGADGACAMPQVCQDDLPSDFQPEDLFVDLGMLIVEGRIPNTSSKGRREGEHCPSVNWRSFHQCDMDKAECRKMEAAREYIKFLCHNAIPLSVEVLLMSECCFDSHDSVQIGAAAEGGYDSDQAIGGTELKCHLLEQWNVQVLPKRFAGGHSQPQLLLQAVRSFLYFSQLSAWLNSTHGQAPHNVVYRVSAPGEVFGANFDSQPEMHTFPALNMSKSACIQVSVATLPRQEHIPQIPCSRNYHLPSKCNTKLVHLESDATVRPKLPRHLSQIRSSSSSSSDSLSEENSSSSSSRETAKEIVKGMFYSDLFEESESYEKLIRGKREALRQKLFMNLHPKENLMQSSHCHIPSPYPPQFLPFPGMQQLSEMNKRKGEFQHKEEVHRQVKESFFIPETWTSTLSDLEMKYSNLKLEEIPSTECLSVHDPISFKPLGDVRARGGTNYHDSSKIPSPQDKMVHCQSCHEEDLWNDSEKEVFQLHNLPRYYSGSEDEDDAGITFSADEADIFCGYSDEMNALDSPKLREYRERTVSDSITCSLDFRREMETCYKHVPPDDRLLKAERREEIQSFCRSLDAIDVTQPLQISAVHRTNLYQSYDFSSPRSDSSAENLSSLRTLNGSFTKSDPNFTKERESPRRSQPVTPETSPLLKNVISKKASEVSLSPQRGHSSHPTSILKPKSLRRSLDNSGSYIFNPRTGLPINSSPAMLRKAQTSTDVSSLLQPVSPLKSSPSCNNLEQPITPLSHSSRILSTSAPAATSCLLGNFEESVLNGRLEPLGILEGFTAEIGASGSFCPKHIEFPVTVYFFSIADEDAPSSYYGHINLESLGKRGYRIPTTGTIQVTLFNPNKTVVKMFVMRYNVSDMPPNCQTFARQRIFYMPSNAGPDDDCEKQLRYLMHIRIQSTKSGKIFLHTDIRIIFARHCPDLESSFGTYELRSFTEVPTNPRFSPKK